MNNGQLTVDISPMPPALDQYPYTRCAATNDGLKQHYTAGLHRIPTTALVQSGDQNVATPKKHAWFGASVEGGPARP